LSFPENKNRAQSFAFKTFAVVVAEAILAACLLGIIHPTIWLLRHVRRLCVVILACLGTFEPIRKPFVVRGRVVHYWSIGITTKALIIVPAIMCGTTFLQCIVHPMS